MDYKEYEKELKREKLALLKARPKNCEGIELTGIASSIHTSFTSEEVWDRVVARVWAENAGEYKHPKNWWEMFKEQCFPQWLKKLMPILYKTVVFSCLYPEFKPIPGQANNIVVTSTIVDMRDTDETME